MKDFYIEDPEKKLSDNDFKLVEQDLGVKLPNELIEFYKKYNGGHPNKTIAKDYFNKIDDIEIKDFIPMLYARDFGDDPDFTLNGRAKEEWSESRIPRYLLAFAMDWGGNYLCLNLDDGEVYYYVMDVWSGNISTEKNFEVNSTPISPSFSYFIDHLEFSEEDDE